MGHLYQKLREDFWDIDIKNMTVSHATGARRYVQAAVANQAEETDPAGPCFRPCHG